MVVSVEGAVELWRAERPLTSERPWNLWRCSGGRFCLCCSLHREVASLSRRPSPSPPRLSDYPASDFFRLLFLLLSRSVQEADG